MRISEEGRPEDVRQDMILSGSKYRNQFERFIILQGSAEKRNKQVNSYIRAGWDRGGEPTFVGIHDHPFTGPRVGSYKQAEFAQVMKKAGTGLIEIDEAKWKEMWAAGMIEKTPTYKEPEIEEEE